MDMIETPNTARKFLQHVSYQKLYLVMSEKTGYNHLYLYCGGEPVKPITEELKLKDFPLGWMSYCTFYF